MYIKKDNNGNKVITIRLHWGYRIFYYGFSAFVTFYFCSAFLGAIENMLEGIISPLGMLLCGVWFVGIGALLVIPLIRLSMCCKITLKERSVTILDFKYGINRVPKGKENNFLENMLYKTTETTLPLYRIETVVYGSIESIVAYCIENDVTGFREKLYEINDQKDSSLKDSVRPNKEYLLFLERSGAFTALGTEFFSKKEILWLLKTIERRGVRVIRASMWGRKMPGPSLPLP